MFTEYRQIEAQLYYDTQVTAQSFFAMLSHYWYEKQQISASDGDLYRVPLAHTHHRPFLSLGWEEIALKPIHRPRRASSPKTVCWSITFEPRFEPALPGLESAQQTIMTLLPTEDTEE